MEIPELKIGKKTARVPIVQGGMGVRVSLSSLASAVASEGGIGTISSIGLGDLNANGEEFVRMCREALVSEIRTAREKTDGLIAVNVMGVLSNAYDLVRASVEAGIDVIFFGAGLPTRLPSLVGDADVALVPIVSSAKAAKLILSMWDRRHGRSPDAFVLEGPLAGGHLGFSKDELDRPGDVSLERLLPAVISEVGPYEEKYGRPIPIIAAGGVYDGGDIARMLSLGAAGVQMGTRFVCTDECDASDEFKQAYLDAGKEDIVITESPVGMLGRAIRNRFMKRLESGEKMDVRCPYKCLSVCNASHARYCIARVLLNAYYGDTDNGLIFCGSNASRVDRVTSVKELISELVGQLKAA